MKVGERGNGGRNKNLQIGEAFWHFKQVIKNFYEKVSFNQEITKVFFNYLYIKICLVIYNYE